MAERYLPHRARSSVGARLRKERPRDRTVFPALVLFDMDDTVFDHSLTCRAALARLRRLHPFLRKVSLDEQWGSYGSLLWTTHGPVMVGRMSADDARRERFRRLAARAGRTIGDAEAERLSQAYRGFYQRLRRPVRGAPAAVRRWHRRARIGIVTNNTVEEQEEKIRFLGLEGEVDLLVASAAIGVAKPDPRIFRVALERAGFGASETVMVGDSWSSDVVGARGVGIRPVWFNRFREPRPDRGAVAEFRSFEPARQLDALLVARPAPHRPD
jgi:HAD superfamily hydrolase (TIGR01549 family)